ncbi:hypothetical protein ZYGR_0N00410 [Zygosaccharomyces rouxii]|uniref:phosphoadenylyl-sulfate reductase (thioredoxin) n=2 Tax=Zygosaccharomyces rouxii TaxID=4956 RepID=C5DUU1_ZYGRC|nr:uncharacterized protein ZYRO0D01408g [Zygosaccharomyces rouxii]KAH9200476.1 Phosphoadenosine phosphosulfate reductase family-domain-containing protein [Zygosaccharomyces rouxii]GAV48637.1 hypothetical protein ZYGR_0N00410 [Zygosaccharomyces rouxii]CAR27560.1 ZYRO0D01408p [Zygosaccharomyces rouxii]
MVESMSYHLNDGTVVTQEQLDHWNQGLSSLQSPQQVLQWALLTFPHLCQTTAFGLTGLATVDMLDKLTDSKMVPLIFIDTLHQFPQTLDLLKKVEDRYYAPSGQKVHIFKPQGCNTEVEFAQMHGDFLWDLDEEKYDFLVKVEPAHRAYKELKCAAVLTGRRKTQGTSRSQLQFIELDALNGIVKINPLALWDFNQVNNYIRENNVPYNELLDLGYKSIGDYHSTQPVKEGEDERAGRWKGKTKTECGLHETSRFAQYLNASRT